MATDITESNSFDAVVYEYQTTDPVLGGDTGTANKPLINLTNRTRWLYNQVEAIVAELPLLAPIASPTLTGTVTAQGGAVKVGPTSGASSPYVDFNSSGKNGSGIASTYDVRLQVSGGTAGTNGQGNLTVTGSSVTLTSPTVVMSGTLTGQGTIYGNYGGGSSFVAGVPASGTTNGYAAAFLAYMPSGYALDLFQASVGGVQVFYVSSTGGVGLSGGIAVGGNAQVAGTTTLLGSLNVDGSATIGTNLQVVGYALVDSTLTVAGVTVLDSTLTVAGATALSSTLTVTGASTLKGATALSSTLAVAGAATFASTLTCTGYGSFETTAPADKSNYAATTLYVRSAHLAIPTVLQQLGSSGSFTVPAGVDRVRLRRVRGAGGGGGAGGTNSASEVSAGGGGGAGGYFEDVIIPVAAGDVISWTIGAGGNAGVLAGTSGTGGGDTIVYKNGAEILRAKGGGGGTNATQGGDGAGGSGGTYTVSLAGLQFIAYVGPGGGTGVSISAQAGLGGAGAASFGFNSLQASGPNTTGVPAFLPGSGGSGGTGDNNGGNGSAGELIYDY